MYLVVINYADRLILYSSKDFLLKFGNLQKLHPQLTLLIGVLVVWKIESAFPQVSKHVSVMLISFQHQVPCEFAFV